MVVVPEQVISWARAAQAQSGASDLAVAGAVSVAGPESSYNPAAVGDQGTSFGLTQLHWGGLGTGYDQTTLFDPVQNLAIAMTSIQASLNTNGGDLYAALRPWSTRDIAWPTVSDVQHALGSAGAPAPVLSLPSLPPVTIGGISVPTSPLAIAAVVAALYLLLRS